MERLERCRRRFGIRNRFPCFRARVRTLHGDDRKVGTRRDPHAGKLPRGERREPRYVLVRRRGIDDETKPIVAQEIGDQVVEHAAVLAQQARIERPAGNRQLRDIVRERPAQECAGGTALDIDDGQRQWEVIAEPNFHTVHDVPVLGMRAGLTHTIAVTVVDAAGNATAIPGALVFDTLPFPNGFPPLQVTLSNPPLMQRLALKAWAFAARRPRLYHWLAGMGIPILARLSGKDGRLHWLPGAGGWLKGRDFPAPQGRTFQQLWRERERQRR